VVHCLFQVLAVVAVVVAIRQMESLAVLAAVRIEIILLAQAIQVLILQQKVLSVALD
jgi:hypothetical protein